MGKQSKNLSRVQDMLDGNFKNKIQVGYSKNEKQRKIGDRWTDSDGKEWEQRDGYYTSVKKTPSVGMFSKQCKDCKKNCSPKTGKPWDYDVWKADGRCYYCQIDYEAMLKTGKNQLKWFAYRRLKDLKNMEAIEKEMIQWVDEFTKMRKEKVFDDSVANAMANDNVEMSIKKNT